MHQDTYRFSIGCTMKHVKWKCQKTDDVFNSNETTSKYHCLFIGRVALIVFLPPPHSNRNSDNSENDSKKSESFFFPSEIGFSHFCKFRNMDGQESFFFNFYVAFASFATLNWLLSRPCIATSCKQTSNCVLYQRLATASCIF